MPASPASASPPARVVSPRFSCARPAKQGLHWPPRRSSYQGTCWAAPVSGRPADNRERGLRGRRGHGQGESGEHDRGRHNRLVRRGPGFRRSGFRDVAQSSPIPGLPAHVRRNGARHRRGRHRHAGSYACARDARGHAARHPCLHPEAAYVVGMGSPPAGAGRPAIRCGHANGQSGALLPCALRHCRTHSGRNHRRRQRSACVDEPPYLAARHAVAFHAETETGAHRLGPVPRPRPGDGVRPRPFTRSYGGGGVPFGTGALGRHRRALPLPSWRRRWSWGRPTRSKPVPPTSTAMPYPLASTTFFEFPAQGERGLVRLILVRRRLQAPAPRRALRRRMAESERDDVRWLQRRATAHGRHTLPARRPCGTHAASALRPHRRRKPRKQLGARHPGRRKRFVAFFFRRAASRKPCCSASFRSLQATKRFTGMRKISALQTCRKPTGICAARRGKAGNSRPWTQGDAGRTGGAITKPYHQQKTPYPCPHVCFPSSLHSFSLQQDALPVRKMQITPPWPKTKWRTPWKMADAHTGHVRTRVGAAFQRGPLQPPSTPKVCGYGKKVS